MVDRDPSLEGFSEIEADSPHILSKTRSSLTPLIGFNSPFHVRKPLSEIAFATGAFIADEKAAVKQNVNIETVQNGECSDEGETDLQTLSVVSLSGENISNGINTERDNHSAASTKLADEIMTMDVADHQEMSPGMSKEYESLPLTPPRSLSDANKNMSLYFRDGIRTVDFVLVWECTNVCLLDHGTKRRIFERGLRHEGLHIEREPPHGGLNFIKIHAPKTVLKRYSEILKLRMPMKEELCTIHSNLRNGVLFSATRYLSQKIPGLRKVHTKTNSLLDNVNSCFERIMQEIKVDNSVFPEKSHRFTAIYSRDKEYLFDTNAPGFWSGAVCSRIVQFVLDRQRFSMDKSNDFAFGIERLIAEGVYTASYPLHDGDVKTPGSMRNLLYTQWASIYKCFRYQPLDYVKDYFGVKIALYFAWLGFYTHMLFPAAIVGLICFIYSISTLYTNQPSEDVCNDNSTVMCPLCDYWCDYWSLKETCLHARVTYLFDNPSTVFFAIFMSFWAALFLELWKRYSAEITHRWDLTGFDIHEEHPRPQYLARLSHVKRKQVNIVTNTLEPHVPFWRMRLPATILSFSVVILLISMALATVLAVVLYRMSILAALSVQGANSVITGYAILFTTATAATINLFLICIFNWIYTWLAEKLTEQELLRTQTEFDDSLTLKIYLLQFVNYYASIFYIAFFKGKFVGRPGDYNRLFGFRQEECGPGGCLMELCIQLSIIMIGKQAVNTVLEIALPALYRWYNIVKTWKHTFNTNEKSHLQFIKDYKLVDWGSRGLFNEYLEMVLQYGFVTIFVAAFPLAPLFALLNNILEMRLDAMKLLRLHRRPVPQRVRDIGVWYRILDSIGKLSVITNGFIIAFTSEFIPRMVYKIVISPDHSLNGYLNHSLAVFNVSDLEPRSAPHETSYTGEFCRYPGYRVDPSSGDRYEYTSTFWHILAARLAFVVIFENVVALVMIVVRWVIPDMSSKLKDRIRREAYVINEIIISRERLQAGVLSPTHASELMQSDDADRADWDKLLSSALSGSEFDLAAHGHSDSHLMERDHPEEV